MVSAASFWQGRRVLVTGHAGFKGSWLCAWLARLGAQVTGVGLTPAADGAGGGVGLFEAAGLGGRLLADRRLDLLDARGLRRAVEAAGPEVVFHLAAQSLVLEGVRDPVGTFASNVTGTVNLLEAVRGCGGTVRAVVVVTSDKCYRDAGPPLAEDAPLGGGDPYSASKACAEIVTAAYRSTYLAGAGVGVATARAGNVIGGGDMAADRLLPDLARAAFPGGGGGRRPAVLRHPGAVRPWQHVLDALAGYLLLAERLAADPAGLAGGWNFGPDRERPWTVAELAGEFRRHLGPAEARAVTAEEAAAASAAAVSAPSRHEVPVLRLSAARARRRLGWRPLLPTAEAVAWTAEGYRRLLARGEAAWLGEQVGAYDARLRAAGAAETADPAREAVDAAA